PGGTVHRRTLAEDSDKLIQRKRELTASPRLIGAGHPILPLDVIVGVDPNLESRFRNVLHERTGAPPDMRAWQQNTVHQGFQPVVLDDRSALDLTHEAGAKHPLDGAPGVIWPD